MHCVGAYLQLLTQAHPKRAYKPTLEPMLEPTSAYDLLAQILALGPAELSSGVRESGAGHMLQHNAPPESRSKATCGVNYIKLELREADYFVVFGALKKTTNLFCVELEPN